MCTLGMASCITSAMHTFKTCLKSRAVNFFMPETLPPKRRIIPRPKDGIIEKLQDRITRILVEHVHPWTYSPFIQLLTSMTAGSDQNPDQVCERAFLDAEFKLVHKIRHE